MLFVSHSQRLFVLINSCSHLDNLLFRRLVFVLLEMLLQLLLLSLQRLFGYLCLLIVLHRAQCNFTEVLEAGHFAYLCRVNNLDTAESFESLIVIDVAVHSGIAE